MEERVYEELKELREMVHKVEAKLTGIEVGLTNLERIVDRIPPSPCPLLKRTMDRCADLEKGVAKGTRDVLLRFLFFLLGVISAYVSHKL